MVRNPTVLQDKQSSLTLGEFEPVVEDEDKDEDKDESKIKDEPSNLPISFLLPSGELIRIEWNVCRLR